MTQIGAKWIKLKKRSMVALCATSQKPQPSWAICQKCFIQPSSAFKKPLGDFNFGCIFEIPSRYENENQ